MVEQVRVNPTEVRGYGNICEGHTLEDFIVSNSGLAKEKETVHGALTNVYKLVYSLYGLIFSFDKGNKQLYLHSDNDAVVGFSFSENSLVFNTVSHISFGFVDKNLVVDDEHYLFIDKCTSTNNKSSGYVLNTGSYSFDNDGLTIDATTFSSNKYQANLRLDDSKVYDVPFTVEFDLLNDGNDNFRLYFHNTSFSNSAIGSGTLWTNPDGQTTKVRFVVTEDGITRYVNDTPTTLSLNQDVAEKVGVRFGYWQSTRSSIKIRNYTVTKV